jgi:hypothetical protein
LVSYCWSHKCLAVLCCAVHRVQVLEFVNCQLFNQLLLRPECCSVSNARYALRGLKQLDTWIIAEQTASQHDHVGRGGHTGHTGHIPHAVTGTGSIHSSSFNSQSSAAAAAPGGVATAADAHGAADGSSAVAGSPAAAAAAAAAGSDKSSAAAGKRDNGPAAAAAGEDEDAGWEQVPADSGDFDSWQPHKQQQQQQGAGASQHWWQWHKQQGGQREPGEQPELGPEAWNALGHVRQVGFVHGFEPTKNSVLYAMLLLLG